MSFIVAIDGPAGSGKGTITKLVGEKLDLINIDTGATFRAVTLAIIEANIDIHDEEKIKDVLENIQIELKNEEGKQVVLLNGKNVTLEIRSKEVNDLVSPVSTLKIVREKLLNLQRKMAEGKNVIMEGRDIGTTVFPNANVKIYLDATPEVRAKRREKQNIENGIECSYEEILQSVKHRDKIDSEREIAPLRKADDAIYVDTSNMKIEEVVEKVCFIIKSNSNLKRKEKI